MYQGSNIILFTIVMYYNCIITVFCKIRDCGKDQKQLFKLTSHLMGNTGQVTLPTHESAEQLATIFGDFYIDKVATIR